jgi:hypothetical protein
MKHARVNGEAKTCRSNGPSRVPVEYKFVG